MKKNFILTVLLLFPLLSFAGGFQLNVQGLRQLAMGGTATGWTWDASSIFYNPGGFAQLGERQAYLGVALISPSVRYVAPGTTDYTADTKTHLYTPFNVYAGGPIKKNGKLSVGLSINTPFGSGSTWEDNWAGRYITREIQLQSIFVQPTAAYRINDMFSVGAGFVYSFGSVLVRKAIPTLDANGTDGEAKLKGGANGIGFNAGLHFKLKDQLQIGLSYRSAVKMKINKGTANFTVPTALADQFPATGFKANLTLPSVLSFGVGYRIAKKLTIQADVNYVGWSSYDSLKFDFTQNTENLKDANEPRLYKNILDLRLGANYAVGKFGIMLGGSYNPTPAHKDYISPDLPDVSRFNINCGLSYTVKKFNIIAAYEHPISPAHTETYLPANFTGKYQATAIVVGIGATYSF